MCSNRASCLYSSAKETGRLATDNICKGTFIRPLLLDLPAGPHLSTQTLSTFQVPSGPLPPLPPGLLVSMHPQRQASQASGSPLVISFHSLGSPSLRPLFGGSGYLDEVFSGGRRAVSHTLLISPTGLWTAGRGVPFARGSRFSFLLA